MLQIPRYPVVIALLVAAQLACAAFILSAIAGGSSTSGNATDTAAATPANPAAPLAAAATDAPAKSAASPSSWTSDDGHQGSSLAAGHGSFLAPDPPLRSESRRFAQVREPASMAYPPEAPPG